MTLDKNKKCLLKNPLTILRSEAVFLALQKLWVNNHLNVKDPAKLAEDFFGYLAGLKDADEVNPRRIRDFYGKLLKENKVADIDPDFQKDMLFQLIEKDLGAAETVLDFGCGKLAYMKNITVQNKSIKKLIGVDSKSQPVLAGVDPRISFERNLNEVAAKSVDLAIIKLVLHHIENDAEIVEILRKIKKVLRPGGKLIIFEESFPENVTSIKEVKDYLSRFGLELAEEATTDFLKLKKEEKMQYLFLNDWLMNMQNKYMPWAWQYKSMEEWVALAKTARFTSLESHFIGAIKKRKRKQGQTTMMIFGN
ncbi:MAG: methyltransferase domain-containing protein [Parcubacteria group bacterium]|jgi:ubiquinone/menaquinone biosynthesis C-methylase UbiE